MERFTRSRQVAVSRYFPKVLQSPTGAVHTAGSILTTWMRGLGKKAPREMTPLSRLINKLSNQDIIYPALSLGSWTL